MKSGSSASRGQAPSPIADIVRAYAQSPEILAEIFTIFLTEAPERQAALAAAVESDDFEAARAVAHSLANTTGTMKISSALELARATESAARAGDREALSEQSRKLIAAVDTIVTAIQSHPLAQR
ncbi:MAG: Hpt domain-containing protein [Spirochaetaceae bacterium]|nr:MAG: Hpt domain-containing protein [Spirochaetaceae bacterium]